MADDNETCMACHGQGLDGIPQVHTDSFAKSIHGKNLCTSCHRDAVEIPHPTKLAPVSCKTCHRIEASIYLESDHGKALSRGNSEAATCTSCHGNTHTLLSSRDPKSPVYRSNIPKTCATCHADQEKMARIKLTEREPFDTYQHSVHGQALSAGKVNAAVCSDCHGTHDIHAASNPKSKIFRSHIPDTCGKCHENVRDVYSRSIHGVARSAGIKEAPVCTDCHGEHTIRAMKDSESSVFVGAITKTCSRCHESERIVSKFDLPADRLKTYQDSYHGMAAQLGDLKAANCASCHGWHDVLPSSDPQASTHPNNLALTCGKCHTGIKSEITTGKIHGGGEDHHNQWVSFFTLFYLVLIPMVLGIMFLHNMADYIRKLLQGPHTLSCREKTILRLNRQERLQHLLLTLTFLLLAISGFALKYPESWWATPFQLWGEAFRKGLHRGCALIFVLTAVWHIFYMAISRRGKIIWKRNLWIRIYDVVDFVRMLSFNLGLSKTRPQLRYPSYIERMEYWALVWGSIVMVVTGSLLLFNSYTLAQFPLWVSDLATVIHFYEAVLACASIVVWHLYWAIFDPDIYPMNLSWITGRLVRPKKPETSQIQDPQKKNTQHE